MMIREILYELQLFTIDDLKWFFRIVKENTLIIFQTIIRLLQFIYISFQNPTVIIVSGYVVIWVSVLYIAWIFSVSNLFIIGTVFVTLWLNFDEKRRGELSAYSIFNPQLQRLLGTFTGTDVRSLLTLFFAFLMIYIYFFFFLGQIDHMMRHEYREVGRLDQGRGVVDGIQWDDDEEGSGDEDGDVRRGIQRRKVKKKKQKKKKRRR